MLQKFGFIKRVDKGWIITMKDLESPSPLNNLNDLTKGY